MNKDEPTFHTLPITKFRHLHCAKHASHTPRLACVIEDKDGIIQWDTFGLSDFIRPSKEK